MSRIKELTRWHEAQTGTCENPAGSNKTRYGKLYGTDGVAWCCIYIWAGFHECGMAKLFYGGRKTASCTAFMKWAKSTGRWVTSDYREGDIILFNFNSDAAAEHIGYCLGMKGGRVITIEGNTSPDDGGSQANGGTVAKKSRPVGKILGAYRPEYEEDEMTQETFDAMMDAYLAKRAAEKPSAWSASARRWAEEQGIITGDAAGRKHYKSFATREELAQMLFNMQGK